MTRDTTLPRALVAAYNATHYRVEGPPAFTLRISEACPALLLAHAFHGVICSAFVTACNPYGVRQAAEVNAARQRTLAENLRARSLAFVPGIGCDPDGHWDGEESFLVFGLAREAARRLGETLEQNAVVWCGADGVPVLELLV